MSSFKSTKLLDTLIYAEDVDNAGYYKDVQGQYDSNGHFVLLTNGTGTTATYYILAENDSDAILMESGDYILQEV